MRGHAGALVALLATVALAGCISGDEAPASDVPDEPLPPIELPRFTSKLIIDDVRAGGEPVIAVTQAGSILVSAHPGWTHYHPSDEPGHVGTEIVTPANAQSYLWKSDDGGDTWRHIGLPLVEYGPRSTGFGVSDPEFTVMEDGTVCYTDLEGLAMSSVSCSTDDGETWIGNPVASQRPNDRQWLASHGDELYFTANYFTDHDLLASTDRGLTWERRGNVPCSYDLVAHPETGTLIVGCSDGIAYSEDGGFTWTQNAGPVSGARRDMTEPAIDSNGTVWMAWPAGTKEHIVVAGTDDLGETWPYVFELGQIDAHANAVAHGNATTPAGSAHIWPWVSAGSAGRLAVTWIGSETPDAQPSDDVEWHVFTALLTDAHTQNPNVFFQRVSDEPIHAAPICQGGTFCQVSSMQGEASGDRRLGDFFETTLDHEGRLHVVVSDTYARPNDVISHVAYFRLDGGPQLLFEGDRLPTQG